MAGFCKLVAQKFALVRVCSGFTWRLSDCEGLVVPPEEASRDKCD